MKLNRLLRTKSVKRMMDEMAGDPLSDTHVSLHRHLKVRDLAAMGIAAIIGAGIFSTIGNAAASGGPAVVLLFLFTALACAFSALCYAEFASLIPISGSAYTYAYATFGELVAWIIGWDLLMEYAIGNIAVAISWSDYLSGFLEGFNIYLPPWICMDYLTAARSVEVAQAQLASGQVLTHTLTEAYQAWNTAPRLFGIPLILDIPALTIVVLITAVVFVGIRESRRVSNIMVAIKLSVIFLVIVAGAFYVDPKHWSPFAPNGAGGVLKGVAAVFFAFIGFDALSTTAEECENPQRDLPKGMIYSLVICTVLYMVLAMILTGLVDYKELAVGDPLAYVFSRIGLNWIAGVVGFTAMIAIAGVLLVFQMGQPRIWMSMSRDGLLPPKFSKLHPRFKTPGFATIVTGIVVAFPALFMNLQEVTELTSIGTLFAFVLVCGGILLLRHKGSDAPVAKFRTPYVNGRFILPALWVVLAIALWGLNEKGIMNFVLGGWQHIESIPLILFIIISCWITWKTCRHQWGMIPVLGLLSCLYLMTELGLNNWLRFGIWLAIGLAIYFAYGYHHSKLNPPVSKE
jgi:amino acid transporter